MPFKATDCDDMLNSQFLKPGDTVDIVAPSSGCHPGVLDKVKALLDSWELQYHIPDTLLGSHILCANSDEKRFEHLQSALRNPNSKAIWCLVGGYGATRLMPHLLSMKTKGIPKLLIGMSDITAIHLFLQQQWGWPTLHGSSARMSAIGKVDPVSIEQLKRFIFGLEKQMHYEALIPLNAVAQKNQTIEGKLIGGNLTIIQNSLGTPWQIKAEDKILFIEEYNERSYRMDRALEQLKQAKVFHHIKGILFGDMIDLPEENGQSLIKATLDQFAHSCDFPVFQIRNIGHGFTNQPLLLGHDAKIKVSDTITLSIPL
jgi:muramoyltetrapeptide carboxypeptidase